MAKMSGLHSEIEQDADPGTVGGRIKYAREMKRLTQAELGKALTEQKSRATIASYEFGKAEPSLDTIKNMAVLLDEDQEYLAFGGERRVKGRRAGASCNVPILRSDANVDGSEAMALPFRVAASLGLADGQSALLQIDGSAPAFHVRAKDWAIIDPSIRSVVPDGSLYAVQSAVGITLIRCPVSPVLDPEVGLLIDGDEYSHTVTYAQVSCIGKVLGILSAAAGSDVRSASASDLQRPSVRTRRHLR